MSQTCSSRTVLLIDDNEDMRDLNATFLRHRGFDLVVAANGGEALRILEDGLRPDLVLLDFHMPGMDARGFREAQRARQLADDVPVILYSADTRVTGDGIGAAAVLSYPIDLDALARTIDAALAARRSAPV